MVLIGGALAIWGIHNSSDPYEHRIIDNVTVAGVNVGGMTKRQAVSAVKATVGDSYQTTDMVLILPDARFTFSPTDTGASLDVKAAVNAAYALGREGTPEEQIAAFDASLSGDLTLPLSPYLHLKEEQIRTVLDDYAQSFTGKYIPTGYTLEGQRPVLEETGFDENAPCQTLILTRGTPGFGLDMDVIFDRVLDAYNRRQFEVVVNDMVTEGTPEPLDLDAIAREICVEPVSAQLDRDTMTAVPGSYGYTFDMEEAKKVTANLGSGESAQISMAYQYPDILSEEVYFQDILGFCQTPHGDNANRNENLRLACASLNGVIIQPGETLSYNETLGQRTAENGYKPAPAYSGTNLVDSIGGGICQVSSTLYLSSLFAELETVDRINHGYPANYLPAGLDATVSWGSPDLKIKNNYDMPVKLLAEEADGTVRVWIMGVETRDYYVKMEFHAGGSYAKTYTCRYDRVTNQLVSREEDRYSAYMTTQLSAAGEIGPDQYYSNGLVRDCGIAEPPSQRIKP